MHHIYKDYYPGNIVVPVLKDVNLNVEEGEYLAIMGPSGSGKSTLMNIIGCLDKPTKGDFKLDGLDILNLSENALADVRLKKLGFVFQNFQLLPRQTAVENVALPLIYAGVGKRERLKRAAAALDKVGLSDRINFVPNQLSGGQKQRAAIASAIASGRSVLFLDEPTSGLDHKHMLEVAEVLREVWDTGISVYVITHDLELIIECCTDVIHFENGTIADQYQMDAEGMEKIRKYFIQEKCCGKWSKSD